MIIVVVVRLGFKLIRFCSLKVVLQEMTVAGGTVSQFVVFSL